MISRKTENATQAYSYSTVRRILRNRQREGFELDRNYFFFMA